LLSYRLLPQVLMPLLKSELVYYTYRKLAWNCWPCVVAVKMLDVVQSSLTEYEQLTGRRSDAEISSVASPTSFSGYTVALLEAVAKMSVYLKEVLSCTYCLCFWLLVKEDNL